MANRFRATILALACLSAISVPVDAAVVSERVDFTASGFQATMPGPNALPPSDPVTGYFLLTFDPAVFVGALTPISGFHLNIPNDGKAFFNFAPTSFTGGYEQMQFATGHFSSNDTNPYPYFDLVISDYVDPLVPGSGNQFLNGRGSGNERGSGINPFLFQARYGEIGNPETGSVSTHLSYSISTISSSTISSNSALPELSTWAMLIVGCTMTGDRLRRRRRKASATFA